MRLAILAFFIAAISAPQAHAGQKITIMSKTTAIRADKQFFAPAIAVANYGDQFDVLEEKGGWYKVAVGKKTGWAHSSATVKGAVVVSAAGFKKAAASSEDVALAGKGFNAQVEGKYKKDHPEMNFAAVDRMEKITVDDASISRFAAEGALQTREAR